MAVQVMASRDGPAMLAIGFMGSAHTVAADLLIYSVARGMLEATQCRYSVR